MTGCRNCSLGCRLFCHGSLRVDEIPNAFHLNSDVTLTSRFYSTNLLFRVVLRAPLDPVMKHLCSDRDGDVVCFPRFPRHAAPPAQLKWQNDYHVRQRRDCRLHGVFLLLHRRSGAGHDLVRMLPVLQHESHIEVAWASRPSLFPEQNPRRECARERVWTSVAKMAHSTHCRCHELCHPTFIWPLMQRNLFIAWDLRGVTEFTRDRQF